ncbi:hypothetical protein GCM10026986_22620 [Nitrincola alkalisediminis]
MQFDESAFNVFFDDLVATDTIEIAETLRKALQFVDADKLYPCTNCGMAPLSRQIATGKLSALAAGTQIVRNELLAR